MTPTAVAVGRPEALVQNDTPLTIVYGVVSYQDPVAGQPIRLPWRATFTAGVLQPGWLEGALVRVWRSRGAIPPHDVMRAIERVARAAVGGDHLPRVEEAENATPSAPSNVIRMNPRREDLLAQAPRPGAVNPPDRRTAEKD